MAISDIVLSLIRSTCDFINFGDVDFICAVGVVLIALGFLHKITAPSQTL